PRRDQPPLQPNQVNRAIAQNADHLLGWCDIIARCCFYSRCDAKGFGNSFDVNGKCIAATHVLLLIGVITNQFVPYILYYSFLTCLKGKNRFMISSKSSEIPSVGDSPTHCEVRILPALFHNLHLTTYA